MSSTEATGSDGAPKPSEVSLHLAYAEAVAPETDKKQPVPEQIN